MEEQIFISHTFEDVTEINKLIQELFADSGIKPFIASVETWRRGSKPNWLWIKEEIDKSKALFLFITPSILKREYTQNWIAYETGIAATLNPQKPVWVFQIAPVEFRIPYLTHYVLMTDVSTKKEASKLPENIVVKLFRTFLQAIAFGALREAIKNPKTSLAFDITCLRCRLNFKFLDFTVTYENFPCPSCSNNLEVPKKEEKVDLDLGKIDRL